MNPAPALFISHGSPLTVVTEDDYAQALRDLGQRLDRSRAVIVMSAHGLTDDGRVEITAGEAPSLIYDFGGFPPELYRIRYPCPSKMPDAWALNFNSWLKDRVSRMAVGDILQFESGAPDARMAHPTTEHFYPIFFTLGCALETDRIETIVDEFQYESLSMYSFALVS